MRNSGVEIWRKIKDAKRLSDFEVLPERECVLTGERREIFCDRRMRFYSQFPVI